MQNYKNTTSVAVNGRSQTRDFVTLARALTWTKNDEVRRQAPEIIRCSTLLYKLPLLLRSMHWLASELYLLKNLNDRAFYAFLTSHQHHINASAEFVPIPIPFHRIVSNTVESKQQHHGASCTSSKHNGDDPRTKV